MALAKWLYWGVGGFVLAVAVVFLGSYFSVKQWLNSPLDIPEPQRLQVIESGSSVTSIARDLASQGILKWPKVWTLYARFYADKPVQAGEYRLGERESPVSILTLFQSGRVATYSITLVEGKTFADYVETLAQRDNIRTLLSGNTLSQQLALLDLPIEHPEGWIFPSTYQYVSGDSDVDILRRGYQKMADVLAKEWLQRDSGLPLNSPYEALILASIVEKETGVAYERGTIAGVFVRRLQLGMRLQTDPTVIYGIDNFDGNLTRRHLKEATPYNTYVIKGLPPTPIAMPGKEAIYAALHPTAGDALYFVAKGDGSHVFSRTLEEHTQAVDHYQRRRRAENYRSSPKNE